MSRDRFRAGKRLWSAADDRRLRQRYPHEPTATLAVALRRTLTAVYGRARLLGLAKSAAYLASPHACRLRRGDHVGAAHRFQRGHVPANKGLRRPGWAPGRMQATQFKKGRPAHEAHNYLPIGSLRLSKDGYIERKVTDDPSLFPARRWVGVHRLVWEAVHGPVPAHHAIAFLPGRFTQDADAIQVEHLECITRRELMARNTVHTLPKPLASAIQLLGALNRKISRRAREEQDRRSA